MTTTKKNAKAKPGPKGGNAATQRGVRFPPAMDAEIGRLLALEQRRRPNATRTDVIIELVTLGLEARKGHAED